MATQSVHFRDSEKTVEAVKNTGYTAWSVWEKKLLLCKGANLEELENFLELLSDSATNAIYTVCYYAKITDKDDIKNTTPHDGAFNFRLNSDGQEITQQQYGVVRYNNELASKVSGLENKIDAIISHFENDTEEDNGKTNKLGIIGDIIAHPAISPMMPLILQSIVGLVTGQIPKQPMYSQPAMVGNVPGDDRQLLQSAINTLRERDPRITEHLTKLANIAVTQPDVFNMILASLDGHVIQPYQQAAQ